MSFSLPKLGVPSPVTTGIHSESNVFIWKDWRDLPGSQPCEAFIFKRKISVRSAGKSSKAEYGAH